MQVIEVMATRAAFGDLMADMRQWLDRNECPLVRCETERGGIRILVKVHFEDNALDERFRQAFRGSYAGSSNGGERSSRQVCPANLRFIYLFLEARQPSRHGST